MSKKLFSRGHPSGAVVDTFKVAQAREIRQLRKLVNDLREERSQLEAGSAKVVESLNASSAHLKRMVELCDKQRADIAELKVLIKTIIKHL